MPLFYEFGPGYNPKPSPTATQKQEDSLYWEKDDINPNQINYDLENNKITTVEDDFVVRPLPYSYNNKLIIKNVSDPKYRNNR